MLNGSALECVLAASAAPRFGAGIEPVLLLARSPAQGPAGPPTRSGCHPCACRYPRGVLGAAGVAGMGLNCTISVCGMEGPAASSDSSPPPVSPHPPFAVLAPFATGYQAQEESGAEMQSMGRTGPPAALVLQTPSGPPPQRAKVVSPHAHTPCGGVLAVPQPACRRAPAASQAPAGPVWRAGGRPDPARGGTQAPYAKHSPPGLQTGPCHDQDA